MTRPVRVLFLSTSFPPNADSQAIRSLTLMEGLEDPEWEWTVVTAGSVKGGGASEFDRLIPRGARVHQTPPVVYDVRAAALERLPLGRRLAWLYRNAAYRLAFPDVQAGWDRQAETLVERVGGPWDVVVSASGSATAHLASARIARRLGVPWVADYGDPWHFVDRDHRPLLADRSERVEREVVLQAHTLVFTTEATERLYQDWLGGECPRTVVLPYGYREADFAAQPPTVGLDQSPASGSKLTLAHIGAAYLGNRTLLPLLRAVAEHRGRYRVAIVGDHSRAFDEEAARLGLTDTEIRQRVPYDEAVRATLAADVLVIVGNKGPMQVPGKVFVTLASGRPILYLSQRDPDSDPAWHVLRQFPGVVSAPNDEASVRALLADLADRMPALREAAAGRRAMPELQAFEARRLGAEFGRLIQEAIAGSTPEGRGACTGRS